MFLSLFLIYSGFFYVLDCNFLVQITQVYMSLNNRHIFSPFFVIFKIYSTFLPKKDHFKAISTEFLDTFPKKNLDFYCVRLHFLVQITQVHMCLNNKNIFSLFYCHFRTYSTFFLPKKTILKPFQWNLWPLFPNIQDFYCVRVHFLVQITQVYMCLNNRYNFSPFDCHFKDLKHLFCQKRLF